MKQIEDPAREGKKALLFEMYLARKEQWVEFEVLQELRDGG